MAKNIQTILGMIDDKTKIIPGHGPLARKVELLAFHDMLIGTSAEVEAMKNKGMSLEKIQAQGLSEKWKSWANGFLPAHVWIGIIYNSLTK